MFFSCIVTSLMSALLLLGSPSPQAQGLEDALSQLDQLLKDEKEITRAKEDRIGKLCTRLSEAKTGPFRYAIMKKLYKEYERYNLDSALYYVHLKENLARKLGDQALINDALNDKADRYIISGMYRYAEEALGAMKMDGKVSPRALVSYYRSLISLHHGLKITNKDPFFNERLDRREHEFRDMIFNAADTNVLYYYTYRAENEMERGRPDLARKELEHYQSKNPTDPNELSILNYCLGKTYQQEGNRDKSLTHYAISAYYDLIEGVRSSRSLIKTARMAKESGQTNRAFSYITRAYDDATQADARVCLEEISRFMPEVILSYDQLNKKRFRDVFLILLLLALFLTACIIIIIIIRQYQVRIIRTVAILETTLGRYATMFTFHINSLEEYRSSIRVVAKSRDLEEITRALRSDDFIDSKRETLLKEFDRTFLGVYPNFVQQLNELLQEDQRIGQNLPEGKLTNELRIFALIRLGVTESADIARFLKKSPSTIYNYRVKLRNAAVCPNEEFEKRLMEIGKR